jgi:AmmeMemoRadiSam system protein A
MKQMVNKKNQILLLSIARDSLETLVRDKRSFRVDKTLLDDELRQDGASFVTLQRAGRLRGCIGTLVATQPLYQDVVEHAIAAGTQDYRFPPVSVDELSVLHYEISILSKPVPLPYETPEDLLNQLQPGVHGVVLVSGQNRATFLPQVWQSISKKEEFLDHLCVKMGQAAGEWRKKHFDVLVYEVQEFSE